MRSVGDWKKKMKRHWMLLVWLMIGIITYSSIFKIGGGREVDGDSRRERSTRRQLLYHTD